MKKIYNELFDETYYKETLDNGLEIIVLHKPDFVQTTACFGTPYGALKIHEKLGDKEYNFNPGIAHFLEHKLFESKGDDILNQFTALGANVNAFTSYKETIYFFSKSDENIDECLNLLLDFVQDLDITDASVEKEKGIICEELDMYRQDPDTELVMQAFKAMYHHYPLKHDIGGDANTVNAITKDELYECYNLNYHPSNMKFVVATPHNPEKIIELVKANQAKKTFKPQDKILLNNKEEPLTVVDVNKKEKMDVLKDKVCYAIKLKDTVVNNLDAHFIEQCLKLYLQAIFTKLNPEYEKWINEGIINDYFEFEVDIDDDYAYLLFINETDKPEEFKKFIDEHIGTNLLTEDMVEQAKRRLFGLSFKAFENIEEYAIGYLRTYLEGVDYFEDVNNINKLSLDKILSVYHSFDYSNYSLIHIFKE